MGINMGDISVIARRRQDGSVQYGWSGNGGYFSTVGRRLLAWYNDPDMVEYLFGLGQMAELGPPFSERKKPYPSFRTIQTGEKHWITDSERGIFSKILFADYGYLYDLDECWYYVAPGPLSMKIPLKLIGNNLDNWGMEYSYLEKIEAMIADQIIRTYPEKDPAFAELLNGYDIEEIIKMMNETERPVYKLFDKYSDIRNYFYCWAVVIPDAECREVDRILIRKNEDKPIETIDWPGHPARKVKSSHNPAVILYAKGYVRAVLETLFQCDDEHSNLTKQIPEWFAERFRQSMGDSEAICNLTEECWDGLLEEGGYMASLLEIALIKGREFLIKEGQKYRI